MAGANHGMERGLVPRVGWEVSDCSVKAALRCFDVRMVPGTSVIDAEAEASADVPAASRVDASGPHLTHEDLLGKILRPCPEDPLTYADMSKHMVQLRKDTSGEQWRKILTALSDLGLGECRLAQARGPHARQFEEQPGKRFPQIFAVRAFTC